ncbi:hypothetical protein PBI_MARYV_111 [Mycobacterium phage MaryV]|uniref:Uncharacterized protein n=1 Tax=Mycobacterium phage MaryV TaxID=2656593 RepID=A0A649VCC3_9CAUD|nr:hypothetical protein PBI_MARYV_111 [Mycobacterium phage MaryV]
MASLAPVTAYVPLASKETKWGVWTVLTRRRPGHSGRLYH